LAKSNLITRKEGENVMKRFLGFFALVLVGVFAFCGVSQAVTFQISDISITPSLENGTPSNTENFTWTVSATPNSSLNLTFDLTLANPSNTFTYGTFYTSDLGGTDVEADKGDNDDKFAVKFFVQPPNPKDDGTSTGNPDVAGNLTAPKLNIIFTGGILDFTFGNGGAYTVEFINMMDIGGGPNNLQAKITLVSDSVADPVPEPVSMLLFGTGLVGVGGYMRKKFKNK
jgi:hypothetical protein